MSDDFTCDRCGKCCQTHRVPVTRADLLRLAQANINLHDAVEFLSTDQVDVEGEPESLIGLREGRRLLVLRHESNGAGSQCAFLSETGCSIHDARPGSCRAYPFDRPEASEDLGLHPDLVCPPDTGFRLPLVNRQARHWLDVVKQRDDEAHAHAEWLYRWNSRQKTRMRLGKNAQSQEELLRALVNDSSHTT